MTDLPFFLFISTVGAPRGVTREFVSIFAARGLGGPAVRYVQISVDVLGALGGGRMLPIIAAIEEWRCMCV